MTASSAVASSPELVRRAEDKGVVTLTLSTPENRNALSLAMIETLFAAFNDIAGDKEARVVVLAGEGGRLDHLLSILLLLGSRRYAAVELDARLGPAAVHVVRRRRTLTGARGQLVSLLALHGPAEGIRTTGLAYPLDGETLEAGSSRGVSNVFVAQTATVSVDRGVLLAIRPGAEDHGGR